MTGCGVVKGGFEQFTEKWRFNVEPALVVLSSSNLESMLWLPRASYGLSEHEVALVAERP